MFGIRFIKSEPTTYLMAFQGGKIVKQGAGLSFLYFGPTTSLVAIPVGSRALDFIFQPVTSDFRLLLCRAKCRIALMNRRSCPAC
jgi:hypothetical protein